MLVAYTDQNEPFILHTSISQSTLYQLRKTKKFFCPLCKQPLLFKIGSIKVPHFAHYPQDTLCENLFSEKESEVHLKGKEQLFNLFKVLGLKAELESYLPNIKQRPDVLLKEKNQQFAIEFQCSPISKERLTERNSGYKVEGIAPIWIPNTPAKIIKKGIQKISLNKNYQLFKLAPHTHPYIMSYNPIMQQFFYISNLMFLQGNSFISKVQTIPLENQRFPFYEPKQITISEFKQFFLIYQQVKHNYLKRRVLLSRTGVNDLLLRSAYELRMDLNTLPNYIGIPIKGSEILKEFSVDWQLALFFYIYTTKIEINNLSGQTIYDYLKWARMPVVKEAFEAVNNYCKLLKKLSVKHSYQTIQEHKLMEVLYTHFLAL
ncbi:MAG TPA: competence protein CoiA family protein [Ureibacillus sp.]|nr:competence protein CoiA family protein [Ureibacillus sp.]